MTGRWTVGDNIPYSGQCWWNFLYTSEIWDPYNILELLLKWRRMVKECLWMSSK